MRILILSLLALVGAGCGCASLPEVPSHDALRETALRLEFASGVCSGTATGPQTLQTASHCFQFDKLVSVNGVPVQVVTVSDDKRDHAQVVVTGITFKRWAVRGEAPKQGDRVRFWGNPKGNKDSYRVGHVAYANDKVVAMDVMTCLGDSGAGLFNDAGELVGMVSAVTVDSCLFGIAFR